MASGPRFTRTTKFSTIFCFYFCNLSLILPKVWRLLITGDMWIIMQFEKWKQLNFVERQKFCKWRFQTTLFQARLFESESSWRLFDYANNPFILMKLVILWFDFNQRDFQHSFYLSACSLTQSLCKPAAVNLTVNVSKNIWTTYVFTKNVVCKNLIVCFFACHKHVKLS